MGKRIDDEKRLIIELLLNITITFLLCAKASYNLHRMRDKTIG